jgi:hypothetical protein
MAGGQDSRLQGGQGGDRSLRRSPIPGAIARRAEHPRPAGQDADQRVQVHGHHWVAGDHDPVAAPVQAEMPRSVTRSVNRFLLQFWKATSRIWRGERPCRVLRSPLTGLAARGKIIGSGMLIKKHANGESQPFTLSRGRHDEPSDQIRCDVRITADWHIAAVGGLCRRAERARRHRSGSCWASGWGCGRD